MSLDKEKILIEEVKVVQDIIKRMAGNSFSIKTWSITLIVITLLVKGSNNHTYIAFIPLFAFWFLDAYYLQQERLFREVHEWIIGHRLEHEDQLFNMNPTRFKNDVQSVFRIMFSISILPFYGGIFILLCSYISLINTDLIVNLFECLNTCTEGAKNGK